MAEDQTEVLIAALKDPSEQNLALLRSALHPNVSGRGMFVNGDSADALIAALKNPVSPAMGLVEYQSPATEGATSTVTGDLPPGLPLAGIRFTVRVDGGLIVEVLQEVVEAEPEADVGIDIDGEIAEFVNTAFERHAPLVLAYVDSKGHPHVSYRGTLQAYGSDSLAVWARNPDGGFPSAVAANPGASVSIIGADRDTNAHYVFEGRAHLSDDETVREQVYSQSPDFEQNIDAGKRGRAIIIELDMVRGGPLGASVYQRREAQS